MLTCINTVLELVATLICVNHLFGKKYCFMIHDTIFILSEVIIVETANYFGWSKGMALFGYIGIYLYMLTKFKCSNRKANANLLLVIIACVFTQIICSSPVFLLEKRVNIDLLMILINCLTIGAFLILSKSGFFYRISKEMEEYEMLTNVATLICFVGAVYLLIVYKFGEYLRMTDYVIFGVWTILIAVLIMNWQREKYDKLAKEKEIELRNSYDNVYRQLLESIRRKQHDFDNQINAIYSQHLLAKDLDELIAMQRKYCGELLRDNRFSRLLCGGSPILIGFLYSKFHEIENNGCHVDFDIKINKMKCIIPQYKIVEIMGILLDNAMEAVVENERRNIEVEIYEDSHSVHIGVKNDSTYFTREEIARFTMPDYSTKGEGRGIGLANVVDILRSYDCVLCIYYEKAQGGRLVFEFDIEKEK